jgi:hypothetical protein
VRQTDRQTDRHLSIVVVFIIIIMATTATAMAVMVALMMMMMMAAAAAEWNVLHNLGVDGAFVPRGSTITIAVRRPCSVSSPPHCMHQ